MTQRNSDENRSNKHFHEPELLNLIELAQQLMKKQIIKLLKFKQEPKKRYGQKEMNLAHKTAREAFIIFFVTSQ